MSKKKAAVSPELVNQLFGKRLASIRRARNITQLKLGKMVELSRASISNLESGIQNVQLHQVFTFAHALNAPVNMFIPPSQDVVLHNGKDANSDRLFLQISKHQLIAKNPLEDDDEDA